MPSFGPKFGIGRGLFCWLLVGLILFGGTGCNPERIPGVLVPAETPLLKAERRGGQFKEVSPPVAIQKLGQKLERYQPQVKILSPKADALLNENQVSIRLQVRDLPIYKDPKFQMGPHLQVFVDDRPGQSLYDLEEPLVIRDLQPGSHSLRVFAARPWDESFKNEGAYAQSTFHVFTKTPGSVPSSEQPLVTYGSPQGDYGAEPLLLDFYLHNAPLHFIAQDDPKDDIADWQLRATIDGESFTLDRWQPIYLKGFKPGQNWLKLEFLDENGDAVEDAFNTSVRLVNYQPGGSDTLAQLVRGKLTAEDAMGIVDPALVNPAPEPEPESEPEAKQKAGLKSEPEAIAPNPDTPRAATEPGQPSTAPGVSKPADTQSQSTQQVKPEVKPSSPAAAPVAPAKPGLAVPVIPVPAKASDSPQQKDKPQETKLQDIEPQESQSGKAEQRKTQPQETKPKASESNSESKTSSETKATKQPFWKRFQTKQKPSLKPTSPAPAQQPSAVVAPAQPIENIPEQLKAPEAKPLKLKDSEVAAPKAKTPPLKNPAKAVPALPKPATPEPVTPSAATKIEAPVIAPQVQPNNQSSEQPGDEANAKADTATTTAKATDADAAQPENEAKPFWRRFGQRKNAIVTPPSEPIRDIPEDLSAPAPQTTVPALAPAATPEQPSEKSQAASQEAARAENAKAEKAKAERVKAEKAKAEKAEAERVRAEKAKAEAERIQAEKAKAERIKAEKAEAERIKAEKAEAERIKAEKAKAEKAEAERAKAEKAKAEAEAEKAEAERVRAEQAEAERIRAEKAKAEKAEAERIKAEKAEAERVRAEKADADRVKAEKAEAERIKAEKAEAEKVRLEKARAEKAEADKARAEKAKAEKAKAETAADAIAPSAPATQTQPAEKAPEQRSKPFWQRGTKAKSSVPSLFEREIQGKDVLPKGSDLEESAKAVIAPKANAPKTVAPQIAAPRPAPPKALQKPEAAQSKTGQPDTAQTKPEPSAPAIQADQPHKTKPFWRRGKRSETPAIEPKSAAAKTETPKAETPKAERLKAKATETEAAKAKASEAQSAQPAEPAKPAPTKKEPSLFEREILSQPKSTSESKPQTPKAKQPFWKVIAPPPVPQTEPLGKPEPKAPIAKSTAVKPGDAEASKATAARENSEQPKDFDKAFRRFEQEIEQADPASTPKESAVDIFGSQNAKPETADAPF